MKKRHTLYIALVCLLLACCGKRNAVGTDVEEIDTLTAEAGIEAENEVEAAKSDTSAISNEPENIGKSKGAYIYVSKSRMRLYVIDNNDSVLFSCGIACGIRKGNKAKMGDYRTPEGSFTIDGIYESTNWVHVKRNGKKAYGCYGPRFLSLHTSPWIGIGIHGTNAPWSIGKRASEGCIRVLSKNILTIHKKYAYTGMTAIVAGEDEPLPYFKGIERHENEAEDESRSASEPSTTTTTATEKNSEPDRTEKETAPTAQPKERVPTEERVPSAAAEDSAYTFFE